jgi:hypothetical protein
VAQPPSEITGHCLCGNVRYRVSAAPLWQGACHCTDCQRQTGTAFSAIVGVPRAALQIEGDTLSSFTTTGEVHGGPTQRHFCSGCGSPIVSLVEALPDLAFIKAGTLDDASWLEPAVEVWTRSAQPWSPHLEGAERIETAPGA